MVARPANVNSDILLSASICLRDRRDAFPQAEIWWWEIDPLSFPGSLCLYHYVCLSVSRSVSLPTYRITESVWRANSVFDLYILAALAFPAFPFNVIRRKISILFWSVFSISSSTEGKCHVNKIYRINKVLERITSGLLVHQRNFVWILSCFCHF